MKSKSPFAMKSPLLAYKSDMTGNYANPEYVPRIDVAAVVGAHAAKTADDVFSSINEADKAKQKAATDKASGGSNVNNQTVNVSIGGGKKEYKFGHDFGETNLTPDPIKFPGGKGSPTNETSSSSDNYNTQLRNTIIPGQKVEKQAKDQKTYRKSFNAGYEKNNEGYDKIEDYIKFKESKYKDKKQMFAQDYKNNVAQGDEYEVDIDNQKTNYSVMNMKGSPVKHNTGAVGSIGNADPSAGGWAGIVQAASQGGSVVGSIGQQMGNQAQQRAAKLYTNRESNGPTAEAAGGMIGVTGSIEQDVLPPPNQVAETGSYGGSGDRMLEMDSNPVGNQSIGRNTDVASQLFGSGQRASMLAMKGTPLHTKGHGGAEGHTHAEPGEYLDQTVAENKNVFDIENYKPIQKFKGGQIVVNSKKNDTIFSTNSTFEIPKAMEGITQSTEGTPKYKPVYINKKSN